ncbi:MAG: hypothetical protein J6W81_05575 [Lentisphaeria bacterium]|nr:hypothetical protein [Lentisphaeria bacterium]
MSVPKPEGPWLNPGETLVCFGDSLTASKNGYVNTLKAKLEPQGIKVINAGLPGDKTPYALTRLVPEVINLKPDAVSIFFGNNDCIIGRGEWRDEPVISPLTFKENLKWIIHLCRLLGNVKKFSINTMTPKMEGKVYHQFGDIRPAYCLAAREAADEANSRIVPLDTVFAQHWEKNHQNVSDDGLLYTSDGLHMTEEGYRLIAEAMLKEWNMEK